MSDADVDRVLAGKVRLGEVLGKGGMGVVHRAEHLLTGRPVAVKVLRPGASGDPTLAKRFVREVKAAAALVHPNVVSVLDFGIDEDGTAFQILELLEGESLADRIARGPMPPERALALLLPIAHALGFAHERGVVHRDVKPGNVLLSTNAHGRIVPKLLDFGIAKVRASDAPREAGDAKTTEVGTVIGTPAYMSPEQARGASDVGVAGDVWALGVLFYECLAGRLPFEDENASIVMARVMLERAPSLATKAPGVPAPLVGVIDRALEPDPAARPSSMAELARLVRAAAETAGIPVPPEGASDCPAEDESALARTDTGPRRASPPTDVRTVDLRPVETVDVAPPPSRTPRVLGAVAVVAVIAVAVGVAVLASGSEPPVVPGSGRIVAAPRPPETTAPVAPTPPPPVSSSVATPPIPDEPIAEPPAPVATRVVERAPRPTAVVPATGTDEPTPPPTHVAAPGELPDIRGW